MTNQQVREAVEEIAKLKAEIEQLRVQLAGCGVAALGYSNGKERINPGDYGYSASYQDCCNLWDKFMELKAEIAEKDRNILELEGIVAYSRQMIEKRQAQAKQIPSMSDIFNVLDNTKIKTNCNEGYLSDFISVSGVTVLSNAIHALLANKEKK